MTDSHGTTQAGAPPRGRTSAPDDARRLAARLAQVEKIKLPLEEHLAFLARTGERCDEVLHELAPLFEGCVQPMGDREREALHASRSLGLACAAAYAFAARARAGTSGSQKLSVLTLKAMRYVVDVMATSYATYSRLPDGAWRQLHQLYLLAEREGVAMGVADAASRTSVLGLYCETLLVSLAGPYRLSPADRDAAARLVRDRVALATVSREAPDTAGTCHFAIECEEDTPPRPARENRPAGTHLRILDTSALVKDLRMGALPGEAGAFAAKIAAFLDDPPKRSMFREAADGSVAICVGVKAIAFFVAHEAGVNGESEALALRQGLTMPLRALPEDESGRLIPIHEWAVMNASSGGLRLQRRASTDYPVAIGEVVGIRAPSKAEWRIGVTRWVTGMTDGTIEFGVQFFANAVCAVWLRPWQAGSERALALLVAEGEGNTEELLLAPAGAYEESREYEIAGEGFRSRVRAAALVEGNGKFELFRVAPE
ncbi:MAG TPA: hypothetical protein VFE23_05265 [Usitatibacter sp.]|jgi:hypothetical protein|nr:hypothetical protein [Usitatibacter sp.]